MTPPDPDTRRDKVQEAGASGPPSFNPRKEPTLLTPSDKDTTHAILQMEVDQAEARATEHVAKEKAEELAEQALAVHFANPLPGEWTGTLRQTELVVIRECTPSPALHVEGYGQGRMFEAVEYYGGARATTISAGLESLTYEQDMDLLTAWARNWGRAHGIYTPAWVFVPVCEHNGQRFYAGVRPSAGMAFAHIVRHECLNKPQDWSWRLTDMDGELLPPPDMPKPTPNPRRPTTERFEWPDGSAIVAHACAWDFGFHRDELEDEKVAYECELLGDEPRFAWPSDLG